MVLLAAHIEIGNVEMGLGGPLLVFFFHVLLFLIMNFGFFIRMLSNLLNHTFCVKKNYIIFSLKCFYATTLRERINSWIPLNSYQKSQTIY